MEKVIKFAPVVAMFVLGMPAVCAIAFGILARVILALGNVSIEPYSSASVFVIVAASIAGFIATPFGVCLSIDYVDKGRR